jgi:hypothetical protein
MRDFQRQAVYNWEKKYIGPKCNRVLPFAEVQTFVDGIWLFERLLYPPKVRLMPKNATTIYARGCREYIEVQEKTPAWIIVHELAHTMTMDIDKNGDKHGPDFVGMYIKMLENYCDVPLPYSMYTLSLAKVKYNIGAQPKFVTKVA